MSPPGSNAQQGLEGRLEAAIDTLPKGKTYVTGVAIYHRSSGSSNNNDSGPSSTGSTLHVLVVKRAADEAVFPNMWEIPGGRVEPGEKIRQTVVRETKEETNLDVDVIIGELPEMHWQSSSGKQNVQMNFVVTVHQPWDIRTDPAEHSEWKWIDEAGVTTLGCTEEMRRVVQNTFQFLREMGDRSE